MSAERYPLETLDVATPCQVEWDSMPGDDVTRLCPECRLHVYNLAAMSRDAANDLLRRTEGQVCVRLFRRADGTVLTSDCPLGLRRVRRQAALLVGGAATLFFGLFGLSLYLPNPGRGHIARTFAPHLPRPLQDFVEWLDPPPVMGAVCPRTPPPPGPAGIPAGGVQQPNGRGEGDAPEEQPGP